MTVDESDERFQTTVGKSDGCFQTAVGLVILLSGLLARRKEKEEDGNEITKSGKG